MEKILLLGLLFYILQTILTCFQIKNFKKNFKELRLKRGIVGMGQKKRMISAGTVVLLACDENGILIEGRQMKGYSVFARFKEIKGIKGLTLAELKSKAMKEDEKKRNISMLDAIEHIESQLYPETEEAEPMETAAGANS